MLNNVLVQMDTQDYLVSHVLLATLVCQLVVTWVNADALCAIVMGIQTDVAHRAFVSLANTIQKGHSVKDAELASMAMPDVELLVIANLARALLLYRPINFHQLVSWIKMAKLHVMPVLHTMKVGAVIVALLATRAIHSCQEIRVSQFVISVMPLVAHHLLPTL